MTARLPTDLLDRSADESARLLALAYLDEIGLAEGRLADPLDSEALHDFRVALRRLRSCTRAYRTELRGSVSKQIRRRLRKLTLATNAGRDAEVHLSWLREQAGRLGPEHTEGLAWLIGRLEGRKYETLDSATAHVGRRFLKVAAKLRPRLQTLRIEVRRGRGGQRPSFRQVTSELIRRHAAELGESLKAVRTAENMAEAHQARVAAKRLRYLLEPLARRAAGIKGLIGQLKGLQDLLGQVHDMHVMSEEIASSLAALPRGPAESPSGAEPGLLALEQVAEQQGAAAFASFEAHWGEQRGSRFFARANELGDTLASPAGTAAEGLPTQGLVSRPRHFLINKTPVTPGLKSFRFLLPICLGSVAVLGRAYAQSGSDHGYHIAREIKLGGEGRWDYVTIDTAANRLFIARQTRVMVVDPVSGKLLGEIPGLDGAHGVALDYATGHGFATSGHDGSVTMFDLKTLEVLGRNPAANDADAILYDPVSKHVFTFNGDAGSSTVIDPVSGKAIGSIALGGKPEFGVTAGDGKLYVNIEDRGEIAEIDATAQRVTRRWSLAPCIEPTGLAIDRAHHRLFSGCHNKVMAVSDAAAGKVISTVPIGAGVDGDAFDPVARLAFASNGEGTLTVIHEETPSRFRTVATVPTRRGARTMVLDPRTRRIFTVAADLGVPPAPTAEEPHPRPPVLPDSFTLLVLEP